jgi:hypothetical protein
MAWTLQKVKSFCLIDQVTGCWLWQRGKSKAGYAQFGMLGRVIYVHRFVKSLDGLLPKGVEICHRCNNPGCVNPDHLYVGDRLSNSEDMVRSGRSPRGSRHGQSKLTEADVKQIRLSRAEGQTQRIIAAQFGVGQDVISRIVNRRTWTHVDL